MLSEENLDIIKHHVSRLKKPPTGVVVIRVIDVFDLLLGDTRVYYHRLNRSLSYAFIISEPPFSTDLLNGIDSLYVGTQVYELMFLDITGNIDYLGNPSTYLSVSGLGC